MKSKLFLAMFMMFMLFAGGAVSHSAMAMQAATAAKQTVDQSMAKTNSKKENKVKKAALDVGNGTKQTGKAVGKGGEKAGKAVGTGSEKVAKATAGVAKDAGKGTAKGVKKVGSGVKKIGK